MVRRRILRAGIGVLLLGAMLVPGVSARANTTQICHIDLTNGGYDLIWVKDNAVAGHLKHGDSLSWVALPNGECDPT